VWWPAVWYGHGRLLPLPISPGWGPWRASGILDGTTAHASSSIANHQWSQTGRPDGSPVGGGGTWRGAVVIVWRWVVVCDGGRSLVAAWTSMAVTVAYAVDDVTCVAGRCWRSL
jgi:hypothetical protein